MLTNRRTFITLVLLAVTTAFSTAILADATPKKFEGTYFFSPDGSDNITASATLHRGGTITVIEPNMFGGDLDNAAGARRNTPRLGVWRQVGVRKLRVTQMSFFSGVQTHEYFTGDENTGTIAKWSFLMVFDMPVEGVPMSYTAKEVSVEIFLPDADPNTADPIDVIEIPVAGKGYRLLAK